jgi:hypothetical protein
MFRIDVTFEMRTAAESKAFIQLIIKHTIKTSFIVETEKGGKGKTVERQRERARERVRALGGGSCSIGCKQTIRKYTC